MFELIFDGFEECMVCGEKRPIEDLYTATNSKYVCAMGRGCMDSLPMPSYLARDYFDELIAEGLERFLKGE